MAVEIAFPQGALTVAVAYTANTPTFKLGVILPTSEATIEELLAWDNPCPSPSDSYTVFAWAECDL
jgi:hypothetical protein